MPAQRCLLHKRRPKAAGAATMRGLPERRSKYFRLAMRRGRKIAKVACGTAERSMQRNSDFSPTHAARYRTSLKRTQLFLEKLVQRLFLPLPSQPQRFSRLQIAYHCQKLLLLPQIDLIHSHLPQRWLSSPLRPATQIAHIDGSHRAAAQAKLSRHSSHRRALAGQPHRL